jgi:hypothetical protein
MWVEAVPSTNVYVAARVLSMPDSFNDGCQGCFVMALLSKDHLGSQRTVFRGMLCRLFNLFP